MSFYTVFGGSGFIGTEVVAQLKARNISYWVPARDERKIYERDLGTVIYCSGAGDCKDAPFSVLDANVTLLSKLLKSARFDKLVYISSTRVYLNNESTKEDSDLFVCNNDDRRLFNLSKLLAEELCLKSNRDISIVRPSNVYGLAINSPLFLPAIIKNAIKNSKVDMFVKPEYNKDYVAVSDVASLIIEISLQPKDITNHQIYNLASGYNVSAKEIANILGNEVECDIIWHHSDSSEVFPLNDISKIKELFNFKPRNVLDDLRLMISDFKNSNV
ncbi:dTDP-glucose 4,6-dehydratase [Vibrio chagasii]|nr:dTDP-glucose 4,6-dehydratase [Vibrio chagasii]CAH7412350.1 dTDP-glucose 4,6-dehydratase [Vibrio chagasii]CAH7429761.1 dTDP-glucose 4,6-dehydratase [Vibrio chagasii]